MAAARTEKIMFTCTPEMKEYLTQRAADERRSVSNLVEGLLLEVIGDSLEADEQPEPLPQTGKTTKSNSTKRREVKVGKKGVKDD
jgi:hypothetical protein